MFKLDTPKTVCREKDTEVKDIKDIYAQKDSCIHMSTKLTYYILFTLDE